MSMNCVLTNRFTVLSFHPNNVFVHITHGDQGVGTFSLRVDCTMEVLLFDISQRQNYLSLIKSAKLTNSISERATNVIVNGCHKKELGGQLSHTHTHAHQHICPRTICDVRALSMCALHELCVRAVIWPPLRRGNYIVAAEQSAGPAQRQMTSDSSQSTAHSHSHCYAYVVACATTAVQISLATCKLAAVLRCC
jgi:hypothetical protein